MKRLLSHVVFSTLALIGFIYLANAQAFTSIRLASSSRGFLTTQSRLPSNILGVLFEQKLGAYKFHRTFSGKSYELVSQRPELLSAKHFSVRESGKSVAIKVRKLDTRSTGGASFMHALYIKDTALYECLNGKWYSVPTKSECDQTDMQLETEVQLQTLISTGRVEDVSSVISESQGLFRIEPEFGFEEGKVYTFEDLRDKDNYFPALNNKIELHIDEPLILSESDVPKLALGETNFANNVYSLQVKFEFPDAFKKYRTGIFFRIKQSTIGGELPAEEQENRFYSVDRFWRLPGGDYYPIDVLAVQCSNYRAAPSSNIQMRGNMQFLEFSDTVFATPIMNINQDFANRPPCVPPFTNSREVEIKPKNWISFKNDYTLCSIEDDLDLFWNRYQSHNTFASGGNLLSSERLLFLLLNTPLEKDVKQYPPCFFGALTHIAKDHYDADTVKHVFSILTTMYKDLGWRFGGSQKLKYSWDYIEHLRLNIESQNVDGKANGDSRFQLFSPLAKTFAEHASEENIREIESLLTAMGKGAQDAIPILLSKGAELDPRSRFGEGIWRLLTRIGLHDQRVITALTPSKDARSAGMLQNKISKINDPELLLYIAKNATRPHLGVVAFRELIAHHSNVPAVGDALFAFANRKFEDSQYHDEILKLLLLLPNRDQDLINFILRKKVYSPWELSKMGLRAQSAAPRLLKEFKAPASLSYFESMSDTMKKIHATRSTLRQAYQLARKSPQQEVRVAASTALKLLDKGSAN